MIPPPPPPCTTCTMVVNGWMVQQVCSRAARLQARQHLGCRSSYLDGFAGCCSKARLQLGGRSRQHHHNAGSVVVDAILSCRLTSLGVQWSGHLGARDGRHASGGSVSKLRGGGSAKPPDGWWWRWKRVQRLGKRRLAPPVLRAGGGRLWKCGGSPRTGDHSNRTPKLRGLRVVTAHCGVPGGGLLVARSAWFGSGLVARDGRDAVAPPVLGGTAAGPRSVEVRAALRHTAVFTAHCGAHVWFSPCRMECTDQWETGCTRVWKCCGTLRTRGHSCRTS